MEVKRGYKQTEVGILPGKWETKNLGEILAYEQPTNYLVNSAEYNNFNDIAVLTANKSFVLGYTDETEGVYNNVPVIIFDDFTTASKLVDFPFKVKSSALKILKLKDKNCELRFVFGKMQLIRFSLGDHKRYWISEYQNLEIEMPSFEEQAAIASALSDADELISSLEKLIAKKRNIKQGAMQLLLTGKKRLPGFRGEWENLNMAEKSILKARIGWQGLTTAEYLESGHYYLVTGTDFQNGCVNWSSCWFVDRNRYMQDANIQLKVKDVLLTKDGTIGKVSYVDSLPGPATLNSGVFVIRPVIRPKNNAYDPLYFYYVLDSHIFSDFLAKLQAGSTISHLYQKDFVNFNFMAPELAEQTAIAQVLRDMDSEIEALERKLGKYRLIKQGMMQELLTGKKRLT